MKNVVLIWSTSVEKDSNIAASLFFSHIFGGLFLAYFLFPHWDNALIINNDDYHTSTYLQLKITTWY